MTHTKRTHVLAGLAALALAACGGESKQQRPPETGYGRAGAVTYAPTESESNENMTPASGAETSTRGQAQPGGATTGEGSTSDVYGSQQGGGATGSAAMGMGEMASDASMLSDEQIAGISDAANNAEIDQATIARAKAKDPRVKSFAQMMIDHHGQAKRDQANLMSRLSMAPAESSRSRQLRTDAQNALSTLNDATGADFDKAYINAQVDAHQKVLAALDNELIPNADNADLKKLLQEIRPRVQSHLTQAKELQQALEKGSKAP